MKLKNVINCHTSNCNCHHSHQVACLYNLHFKIILKVITNITDDLSVLMLYSCKLQGKLVVFFRRFVRGKGCKCCVIRQQKQSQETDSQSRVCFTCLHQKESSEGVAISSQKLFVSFLSELNQRRKVDIEISVWSFVDWLL